MQLSDVDVIALHVLQMMRLDTIVWEWNGKGIQNSKTRLMNSRMHLMDLVMILYTSLGIYIMLSQFPVHINMTCTEEYLPPKSNTY